jgi:hypothetical protein
MVAALGAALPLAAAVPAQAVAPLAVPGRTAAHSGSGRTAAHAGPEPAPALAGPASAAGVAGPAAPAKPAGKGGPSPVAALTASVRGVAGPAGPVQQAVRSVSIEVTRARGVLGQGAGGQGAAETPAKPRKGPYGSVPGAGLVFDYDTPQISGDGDHITWHWSMVNMGTVTASHVLLIQQFNRPLDQVKASAPCEVSGTVVRCRFASVPAGGREEGTVEGDIPGDASGTIQINGRITWQQGPDGAKAARGQRRN